VNLLAKENKRLRKEKKEAQEKGRNKGGIAAYRFVTV